MITSMKARLCLSLATLCVLAACQSAQEQPGANTAAGETTYTRGADSVARSETTRVTDTTRGGSTAGEVTLTLTASSYAAGADVTMRITNSGRDTLGYNPCSNRTVQQQRGSAWTSIAEPDRMCTMELRLLNPGQTVTATTDLPTPLPAGTYRITLSLSRQSRAGGTVVAASLPFSVR